MTLLSLQLAMISLTRVVHVAGGCRLLAISIASKALLSRGISKRMNRDWNNKADEDCKLLLSFRKRKKGVI